ncbi:MAG: hypothetical protein ABW321_22515 [Polyangiales bacterium]
MTISTTLVKTVQSLGLLGALLTVGSGAVQADSDAPAPLALPEEQFIQCFADQYACDQAAAYWSGQDPNYYYQCDFDAVKCNGNQANALYAYPR